MKERYPRFSQMVSFICRFLLKQPKLAVVAVGPASNRVVILLLKAFIFHVEFKEANENEAT